MINDVTTTTADSAVMLFVIMPWITIHIGKNPRNGGSPPKDDSDMNIMNIVSVVSLFVIMVWLINYAPDN